MASKFKDDEEIANSRDESAKYSEYKPAASILEKCIVAHTDGKTTKILQLKSHPSATQIK